MNTTAVTTTSLPAHKLASIIDQVIPHMYQRDNIPLLASVHLDSDGTHLHAVASDRYTMAVARSALWTGEAWTATVSTKHIAYLQSWAEAHGHKDAIHLATSAGELTASSNQGRVTLPTFPGEFPAWRKLFREHLDNPVEPMELSGLDTDFLRRWEKAGRRLRFAQSGAAKPLVIFGENFLGMQMPCSWTDGTDRGTLTAAWAESLQAEGDEPISLPLPDPTNAVPEMGENLLRRIVISTEDMWEMPYPSDPSAMAAHSMASVNAWIGYRLLQELQGLDPKRADAVVAELSEELDAGDFAELAWDYAQQAGHDPEKWRNDYKAARKARAEKAATAIDEQAAED